MRATSLMACAVMACSSARAPAPEPTAAVATPTPNKPNVPRRAEPVLLEDGFKTPWQPATPEQVHLRREALAALVASAEATESDALLVIRGDRVVVARAFGHAQQPLEVMSVTKGFGALAIGFLVGEGKIASLDAPMSRWLPEWNRDAKKARVTLRHVLTHTSGLAHKRFAKELKNQRDRVAYVRALPVETEPGEVFSYNNEATQLLSLVIASAAGEPIDAYLRRKLFQPLGIERFEWARDESGNPAIPWGLSLAALDLAKVGVTLRDDGVYQGKRVVPETWTREMLTPTEVAKWHGLLTWLLYDGTVVVGWNFNGWLGQYLVVYPQAGIVAVRQRREPANVTDDDNERIGMKRFAELVRAALP